MSGRLSLPPTKAIDHSLVLASPTWQVLSNSAKREASVAVIDVAPWGAIVQLDLGSWQWSHEGHGECRVESHTSVGYGRTRLQCEEPPISSLQV